MTCSSAPRSICGATTAAKARWRSFPTSRRRQHRSGIGNGATEGGLIAPLSISLPDDFTLVFNSEIDALKDSADNGRHANFINLVNISRPVVKDVTLYLELWSDYNDDPTQKTTQLSFDAAFAWVVRPNLQLDFGADVGLTNATPNIQVFAGISQRF